MKDLSFVDVERAHFPSHSSQYKHLVSENDKDDKYILCYNNLNSLKVPKVKSLSKVIEKRFVIPFIDTLSKDEYNQYLELVKVNHFDKTVSSIYGITAVNKVVAEFSPFLSQICAGALLVDKKGRVLVLVKKLEDDTEQFHIPQTHVQHSVDVYTKTFNQFICDNANNILNEYISLTRLEGELEPINLMSGYVLNLSETLATSMHTLFAVVYQIDDFEKYEIRCRDTRQRAMILDLNEAIDAARTRMMDPWLAYVYANLVN